MTEDQLERETPAWLEPRETGGRPCCPDGASRPDSGSLLAAPRSRSWDKGATKDLLFRLLGRDQFLKCEPALRSVTTRLSHAQYHFAECRRLTEEFVGRRQAQGESICVICAPMTDEESHRYHRFFVECEAHMLAGVLAIHAVADNLAYLVYYALSLDQRPPPLDEDRITLRKVAAKLNRSAEQEAALNPFAQHLSRLRDDPSFKRVEDIANQSKHRGGPHATLAIEPAGEETFDVCFSSYVRGEYRSSAKLDDVLAPAFRISSETVVNTGLALYDWLVQKMAAGK